MEHYINVTLTPAEFFTAAQVGMMRHIKSLSRGSADNYGASKRDGWRIHIEGACGEMAAAKALGVYWHGSVDNWTLPDIDHAAPIEVRTTAHRSGRLILHDRDRDDAVFILVRGTAPRFEVVGWIMGREGKRPEYLEDPQGTNRIAYFVPECKLESISLIHSPLAPGHRPGCKVPGPVVDH